MSDRENELVVDDAYCKALANFIYHNGTTLDEIIKRYVAILQVVSQESLVSGEAKEAFDTYLSTAKMLQGCLEKIVHSVKTTTQSFTGQIDKADQFLY